MSRTGLYTKTAYRTGKFGANIQVAQGNNVISSFFMETEFPSETVYWNELDFEKITDNCNSFATNAHFGLGADKTDQFIWVDAQSNLCEDFHLYTFEWTPNRITWLLDGKKAREETGNTIQVFVDNAGESMDIRFNVWVGNADFGKTIEDSVLPVHRIIDWV